MRTLLTILISMLMAGSACAQTYNNEWIDFSKTYYKFPVGADGLYRISQPALATIGLGNTPAQNFQLWRNGKEIPLYTSVASGSLGVNGFIEFFGEMNDGKTDKLLYKYDSLQIADKWSLYTDSSMYFLTVNTGSVNKRYSNLANDVAGNVLPAENSFQYTYSKYYRDAINNGYAVDYGELLYSSSYETGEGWTTSSIAPGSISDITSNLYVDNSSSSGVVFDAQVAGNSGYLRRISVRLNSTQIADTLVNGYNIKRFHVTTVPLSQLSGSTALIQFYNNGSGSDKIVVAGYQLTYPRLFNFDGQSMFRFNIPAGGAKYIEISNFNFGNSAPVLLDPVNQNRIVGNISGATVRFVLPATASGSNYVLLNTESFNIKSITGFTQRNFINHSLPSQQGNYVIISHPALYDDGTGVNQVELYRQYRSSTSGGGFNAVIKDINELTDQFAFGIKHHPLAIRNFSYYSQANFTTPPINFLLIGKGLNYQEFRKRENDPNVSKWALIPTFGYPASDNLLFAQRTLSYPQLNLGRISAVNGKEVKNYLEKVKQFELAQLSTDQTIGAKGWMKNVAQVTGAIDDPSLSSLIDFFMSGYSATMADTFYGAKVYNFNKNSGSFTAVGTKKTIDDLFNEGLSYLTYFGHSSPNTLEFNLDDPGNYSNSGKYPLIMVNGCNTGNLFLFDTLRALNGGTLSEKYVFANQKGSIAFIADTHFGLPQQLEFFTSKFDQNLAKSMYGATLGEIMRQTDQYLCLNYSNDYATRIHAEEIAYHGDPAIRLNPFSKADFAIRDSLITLVKEPLTVADASVDISIKILNIGKAVGDSMNVMIRHQLPDQSIRLLETRRIPSTRYEDVITVTLNIDPVRYAGTNKILVSLDASNEISELSESNNTASKTFEILRDDIRPVYPYRYSIIGNDANLELYGSTADPLNTEKTYVLEMDTTRLYNSPIKISRSISSKGGLIKFVPGTTLLDSTVYYWRLTTGPVSANSNWQTSSFTFIRNADSDGYAQSQFYQHTDSKYNDMRLDSASRMYQFDNKTRKLLIRTGLYPFYLYDQINVNVDNDKIELYGCQYNSLQFVVYNPLTLIPWKNWKINSTNGRFGSGKVCLHSASVDTTRNFFEFNYPNATARQNAMNFFDSIPNGYLVSITNLGRNDNTSFIDSWKADTLTLGSGRSLWHKFHQMGLHKIDSFTTNKPFLFLFRKGDTLNFPVRTNIGSATNVHITDTFLLPGKTVIGSINSPDLGPAKQWKRFKWKTTKLNTTSSAYFDLYGIDADENLNWLASVKNATDTSISFIDAGSYPKMQVIMNTTDPQNAIPVQLKYWMLTSNNYPEGALAPNIFYSCKDTLYSSDSLYFKIAFKNVSDVNFDSIKVRLTLKSSSAGDLIYQNLQSGARLKPLIAGDTVVISYAIPMTGRAGMNQLILEVNPGNDQPEQFHFNNVLQKSIYVIQQGCIGSNVQYAVANQAGYNYQWQVNTGAGFVNLTNNGTYSGVFTPMLTINSPATGMAGYHYRVIQSNTNESILSQEFILKFSSQWIGGISNNWHTAGNWSCNTVPDANTDVIVKSGTSFQPVIGANAVCHTLNLYELSQLLVKAGFGLQVTGK